MPSLTFAGTVKKKAAYTRWYRKTPAAMQERPVTLREVAPPQDHASWYRFETETIYLVRGYGDNQASLLHELGHHAHLHWPADEQAEWAAFWARHRLEMPSRYGRQSAVEGFPELFSYWAQGKKVARVLREWLEEKFR